MVLPTDFISLLKGSLSSFRKLKILAACIVLWFLWAHFFSSSAEVSNSIILLKLPRSGSSWLTDELNAVSAVYVAKEILQTNDSLKLESEVVEKHLSEALLFPSDKAWRPYSWTMLPTTRYLEDYVYSGKFLASLKFVGFSLNPEHIPNVRWNAILRNRKPTLLILTRLNIIKSAISGYYGSVLKHTCGVSNVRQKSLFFKGTSSDCVDAVMTRKVPWTRSQFVVEVNRWLDRTQAFYNTIKTDKTLQSCNWIVVSYEGMQHGGKELVQAILQRILEFSSSTSRHPVRQYISPQLADATITGLTSTALPISSASQKSTWAKRTKSEDLRDLLEHYDDILEPFLLAGPSCACIRAMLMNTNTNDNESLPLLDGDQLPMICAERMQFQESASSRISCH